MYNHWRTTTTWATHLRQWLYRTAAVFAPPTPTTIMPPPEPTRPTPDLRLYDTPACAEDDCADDCPCDCGSHCVAACTAEGPGGEPSCCDGGCRRYLRAVEDIGRAADTLQHTQASPDARLATALAIWRDVHQDNVCS